ncbi:MAG: DUF4474 domain-containing protein [Anaerovoracaceae bacterium]|jgi:hypothetical protein
MFMQFQNILLLLFIVLIIYFIRLYIKVKKLKNNIEEDEIIDQAIENAGYSYDSKQDIFYSKQDAWQKKFGYCKLYDEAAAPLGMIIDCEPITFEYDNKKWLFQMWKGQYGMTTGCEVGIYTSKNQDLNIPGVFNGTYYDCANEEDQLNIYLILKKNQSILFTRKGKHWWLTGFKLGEFSQPWDLKMEVRVTLKDKIMCQNFVKGLKQNGYATPQIQVFFNTVRIHFDKPYSPQPLTRTKLTEEIAQRNNKNLCFKYQEITTGYQTTPEKIKAIKQKAPQLYHLIPDMGKPIQLFKGYEKIQKRLSLH